MANALIKISRPRELQIITAISFLYAALFIYTGVSKLRDAKSFHASLNASPLLEPFAAVLTYAIPGFEILISLLLLFNTELKIGERTIPSRKVGLIAGGGLMSLFTLYIATMLTVYDKEHLPCTCGGFISQLSWWGHIPFNLIFVVLAFYAIKLYKHTNPKPI